MAITQTGAIYKAFSFDNVSSRNYGVYITGEAVYNAPERDVEMIAIPGRNGSFALDNGRFENIEVKYPAGIATDNETDFAQAVSDLRNYLCSKKGYFRLTDEYNPNEYRMAVYKSGLEVLPVQAKAGEFEIIFECKPQRWLTSGETEIDVSDGDTITNPTLFDASPMLEVEGYGTIGINDETITIKNVTLGEIPISEATSNAVSDTGYYVTILLKIDVSRLNNNNLINLKGATATVSYSVKDDYTITGCSVGTTVLVGSAVTNSQGTTRSVTTVGSRLYYGTSSTSTSYATFNESWTYNGVPSTNSNVIEIKTTYDGADAIEIKVTVVPSTCYKDLTTKSLTVPTATAQSTKSALGNPLYIDLDIGEAWNEDTGTPVSLNHTVYMPVELPKLKSGNNEITLDNTITDLKVVPRWWKV